MELSDSYNKLLQDPFEIFAVLPNGDVLGFGDTYQWVNAQTGGLLPLSIYPGSWNPVTDAHRAIFDKIESTNGWGAKAFELSICRMGKEPLELEELSRRLSQFSGYAPVIVTNAARFIEKCAVFRWHAQQNNIRWHVGVDTIKRMRDDYGEVGLAGLPGHFVVYDRHTGTEVEKYPLDFKRLPPNVRRSDYQLPAHLLTVSSTKIRNGTKTG